MGPTEDGGAGGVQGRVSVEVGVGLVICQATQLGHVSLGMAGGHLVPAYTGIWVGGIRYM